MEAGSPTAVQLGQTRNVPLAVRESEASSAPGGSGTTAGVGANTSSSSAWIAGGHAGRKARGGVHRLGLGLSWRDGRLGSAGPAGRAALNAGTGGSQYFLYRLRLLGLPRRRLIERLDLVHWAGRRGLGNGCRTLMYRRGRYRLRGRGELFGSCLGARLLQGLDGLFEAQTKCLQQSCRRTLSIADDRSKDDGTVDLAAARLLCGLPGRLKHPMQLDVRVRLCPGLGPHILQKATQVVGYVRPQLDRVDVAGAQNPACVGILDEREQQMLEQARRDAPEPARTRGPARGSRRGSTTSESI